MPNQIFLTNLPQTVSEEWLRELFSQVGEVGQIKVIRDQATGLPRGFAFVDMGSDEQAAAAIDRFNGFMLDDQPMVVRQSKPQASKKERIAARRAYAEEIAQQLNEENPVAKAQLRQIVETQGRTFARKLLEETQKIEAEGGMLTLNGKRRRTPGGVFLFLAWQRIPDDAVRFKIFPRRAKGLLKEQQGANGQGEQVAVGEGTALPDAPALPKPPKPASQGNKGDRKPPQGASQAGPGKKGKPDRAMKSPDQPKSAPPKPAPPRPAGPQFVSEEQLEELRDQLAELRRAEQAAEQRVEDIRARRVAGGLFTALKEVAEIKAKISDMLKDYPQLN